MIELVSRRLEVHLRDDDPLCVERIIHRPTGRIVARQSRQTFLARFPMELSDPTFATHLSSLEVGEHGVTFRVTDERRDVAFACAIDSSSEGIAWRVRAESTAPLWMMEWRIGGLELARVIVPALGGQSLSSDMPADTQVTYKYPFWWNAQFGIGELSDGGGIWLRTLDTNPTFKLLRVSRSHEEVFGLGLGIEADAPLDKTEITAEWYLDAFNESWKEPVDVHRRWLESAFGLAPFSEHRHYPPWVEDIDFILEIWGASKERAAPLHTFPEIIERIRRFAHLHAPEKTLLYLPGFANRGIDSGAPDYTPAAQLGGAEAFEALVDEAHRLGYRVMIHTNVLAMAFTHRDFPRFESMQVVDAFGRSQGWGNDIDGDWLHEPFFAYVNPGFDEWGDYMTRVIGDLVEQFAVDAVFLDQTLLAFNVSRGPRFVEGMRRHIERLQTDQPDILFAGEGVHEHMLPVLPMAQIHGVDSITGVHGLEGAREWRHVHPVSSYLFGRFTRLTAHLLTRHPSNAVFDRQEAAYAELGIVPALVLYRESHEIDTPAVHEMLRRGERLNAARRASSNASLR